MGVDENGGYTQYMEILIDQTDDDNTSNFRIHGNTILSNKPIFFPSTILVSYQTSAFVPDKQISCELSIFPTLGLWPDEANMALSLPIFENFNIIQQIWAKSPKCQTSDGPNLWDDSPQFHQSLMVMAASDPCS